MNFDFLIVGAGFSGAVLARQLADNGGTRSLVVDERSHVGGNCHTERDAATGVMVHQYGPHIFNTDNERVWQYVNRFGDFRPFINRVKIATERGIFSLPINLHTINQFFGKTLGPDEARAFLASLGDHTIGEPQNFEEQALKMLGRDLYESFFKGYTIKQWGCDPKELPASILKRLPVRFNYDDNYYNKRFQGIPEQGYSAVIQRMLDHPNIEVQIQHKFLPGDPAHAGFKHIFYTGPIDAYFSHCEGRLGYRTVTFERLNPDCTDYQGNAVINYGESSVPWTRIHEHKHFAPWEQHERTVVFREYSKETEANDVPYYPKRLDGDRQILQRYRAAAENLANSILADRRCGTGPQRPTTSFLGRLATYRYMDMEAVIGEALEFADRFQADQFQGLCPQVFPNKESF